MPEKEYSIIPYKGKLPEIEDNVFIGNGVVIAGDVIIKKNSSVWFNTVIRGDVNYVRIGENTNIQELSSLHVDTGTCPLIIGDNVTVGHNAILHGCTIGNCTLIGMGAIVLSGAEIGEYSVVGAGALVTENAKIPPGVLVMGIPAKIKRELSEKEKKLLEHSAEHYKEIAEGYR